jgi:hypothetical protein
VGKKGMLRADKEVVPEAATRPSQEGDYHTGRGGAANVHHAEKKEGPAHKGLADKLKGKIMGVFKK